MEKGKGGNAVVVSGGSRGLGAEIIKNLLTEGFTIATFSRTRSWFIDKTLKEYSHTFYWEQKDINNRKGIRDFIREAGKKFNGIGALINNVGLHSEGIFTNFADKNIENLIDVNIKGTFFLTQACLKHMLLKKKGNIINISSIVGLRGFKGLSVYGATKAAIDGFTRSLAREYGSYNIKVNAIAPGYLETDMTKHLSKEKRAQIIRRTPLQRLGDTKDIAGLVKFLLSEEAKFITGQTIVVDGGLTC